MENDWKLEIRKVNNGYVLKGKFGETDFLTEHIIEIPDDEFAELKAMELLLQEIKEFFAVYYSKHDKKNLIIEIADSKEE